VSVSESGDDGAIVIWLDGSLQTGCFENCHFLQCRRKSGKLIVCQESQRVVFGSCCFDCARDVAFNANGALAVDESNAFGSSRCEAAWCFGVIGFVERETVDFRARVEIKTVFQAIGVLALAALAAQFVVGIGITSL